MLDMSRMRGVWVDPTARTARAQAGCLLGDVDRETQIHGLAAVLGFVSNTGIAGLTLGGGFGYLTRQFGWTSDNVSSMDLVTAEGRVVRASERENADLFWGLRGGGGNFGVVTRLRVPALSCWTRNHRQAQSPGALKPRASSRHVPRRHGEGPSRAGLRRRTAHGAAGAMVGQGCPRQTDCRSFRLPHGLVSRGREIGCSDQGFRLPGWATLFSGERTSRNKACSTRRSRRAGAITGNPNTCRGLNRNCSRRIMQSRRSDPLAAFGDPALSDSTARSTAFPKIIRAVGNRDTAWVLNITASWEKAEDDRANIEWARAAWQDMRRFSTGGTYINFLTEEEGDERIHAAYGNNYERLVEIKSKWDPA